MAAIGNSPTQQAFTPAIDYFSGNGSTTAFTLSRPVASVAQVQVTIDNVAQNPSSAYTVSANTITFTSAPLSGTNNIYVYYTSPITQVIAPGQSTVGLTQFTATGTASASTFLRGDNSWQVVSVTPTAVSDQTNTSTGYFDLPAGTTGQRPGSLTSGQTRYNTTLGVLEYSDGTYWYAVTSTNNSSYSANYLAVAGGGYGGQGGGASNYGDGGGGGGGVRQGTVSLTVGTVYTITVGAGGTSANGSNSSLGSLVTASGGGQGGGGGGNTQPGVAGGSGGGQGSNGATTYGTGNLGNYYPPEGYSGGTPSGSTGGGGGGAGGAGGTPSGGAGVTSMITGTSATYGAGGAGGGGGAASANTGNGGNGGTSQIVSGGNGGSGIVIISVPTANYTGTTTGSPTVTTNGSNTVIKFTSSGSYTA
jgi:hypothetical protein